jgi:hypothetical protein
MLNRGCCGVDFRFEYMELNINNYEEYFLLYADNELSVEEMKHVELFVSENPVLKEEFEHLLRTVVTPDTTIELVDKSFLFKRESSFDTRSHEENFVLYHDKELSNVEESEVEKLIQENPVLKEEFDLIKKARVEADEAVVFPDKHLLYRKEKDRVIPLIWWWAAAAILLGMGTWMGVKYLEVSPTEDIAKGKPVAAPKTNDLPTPLNNGHTAIIEKKEEKPSNQEVRQDISPVIRVKHITNDLPVVNNTEKKKKNNNQQNTDAKNQEQDINTALQNVQKTIDNVMRSLDNLNKDSENQRITQPTGEYKLQQASYVEDNNSNLGNDDYAFYNVSKKDFNKSKIGVLLKKTKRIIGRNLFRKKDKDSND